MIYIEVQVYAGSGIFATAREAVKLAKRVGVTVRFKFNGVECPVTGEDDPVEIAMAHAEAMRAGYTHLRQRPPITG